MYEAGVVCAVVDWVVCAVVDLVAGAVVDAAGSGVVGRGVVGGCRGVGRDALPQAAHVVPVPREPEHVVTPTLKKDKLVLELMSPRESRPKKRTFLADMSNKIM